MANLWMPLYVADYLADTGDLTTTEHGAYMLLIMQYWTKGSLPDNDRILAQITRLRVERWKTVRPQLERFFTVELGKLWKHHRIDRELEKAADLREKRQSAAAMRWCNSNANALQMDTQPQPQEQTVKTTTKVVNLNGFIVGSKNGLRNGHTIQDPGERLNRFQKWLAEALGKDGYSIVGAALDSQNPLHKRSLALCKAKAEALGKGWPHQWPR